jgi:hypothetical protein
MWGIRLRRKNEIGAASSHNPKLNREAPNLEMYKLEDLPPLTFICPAGTDKSEGAE